jgi:hypothetical protein
MKSVSGSTFSLYKRDEEVFGLAASTNEESVFKAKRLRVGVDKSEQRWDLLF